MKPELEEAKAAKQKAALEAANRVKNHSIIGLGSGSTAALAIERIGERIKQENLSILGIPTSTQAFFAAVKNGIPITTLEEHPEIDMTIDGADQVDPKLNLIKGMGAALAREKIVAASSKLNIIIADESKKVKTLGEKAHPVPVEVLPFAVQLAKHKIEAMKATPVIREGKRKLGPVITDNGNMILDVIFGLIADPGTLEMKLKMIPGVVETGLFIDLADIAIFGAPSGIETVERRRR